MYTVRVKTIYYNNFTFAFGTLEEAKKIANCWREVGAKKVEIFSHARKPPYKVKF